MKAHFNSHRSLYIPSTLDRYLEISPDAKDGVEQSQHLLKERSFPREQLASLLTSYNHQINNWDPFVEKQIERLKTNHYCIITGQQLGLMGGPAYTVLKAISCLLWAKKTNSVPIFWLATEDHDIAEINHTYLIDGLGNLQRHSLALSSDKRFVEDLIIDDLQLHAIDQFFKTLQFYPNTNLFVGERYATAMASLLAELFRGTGLVFVEPYLLRPLAKEFFQKEILYSKEIENILKDTTERFKAEGGNALLEIAGTNLFYKDDQEKRQKIYRTPIGFTINQKPYTQAQLLNLIEHSPQKFSPNVAGRPVLQSLLFPTLAYVAGPSEIQYYRQLKDYHHFHAIAMPWVIPRLSATLVPSFIQDLIIKLGLDISCDLPIYWDEIFPDINQGIQALKEDFVFSVKQHFADVLSSEMAEKMALQATQKIQSKVWKKRLAKQSIPSFSLHLLNNFLFPRGKLQERTLNWYGFQASAKHSLIHKILSLNPIHHYGHYIFTYE